jgi:hypothetical protein
MKLSTLFSIVVMVGTAVAQEPQTQPRVFLQANSHGNVWASKRDQSMEMAKDFQKNCPDVKITILQTAADYTVILNHIEVGAFGRDNQFQIANKEGDMLSGVREKKGIKSGSINGGVKAACDVILADWKERSAAPAADQGATQPTEQPAAQPVSATTQQQNDAQIQPATQTTSETANQDQSVADMARAAKQYQACLDLAKNNPSVTCK